jgi:hypothetical protein
VIVVAVAVVVASTGVGAYLWDRFPAQSSPPTRDTGLQPEATAAITTSNGSNGPGGCSAPGPGLTEFCYDIELYYVALLGVLGSGAHAEVMEYETTADASFLLKSAVDGSNVTFENITLLNATGRILATYVPGSQWSAYGSDTLPIILSSLETLILNVGTTTASGDYLEFDQGAWGSDGTQLP